MNEDQRTTFNEDTRTDCLLSKGKMEDVIVESPNDDRPIGEDDVMDVVDSAGATPSPPIIWTINVRSPKLPGGQVQVPIMPENELSSLVGFVNEVLGEDSGVALEYSKLLVKGKVLDMHSTAQDYLRNGDTVMLLFSSKKEVEEMRKAEKVDNRIRSFEEEEELHRKRVERSSTAFNSFWGEDQDATYKFVKIEACPRFKTPHPFEAEKLLQKLATDPGVKKIMRKYKWTVGTLAEMDPKSDMISLRKEQDGVCVLGYNENAGHKIYLRLRTDDELEFRGYDGLINTLLHELTHNVRGPHDEEFWRVFGQLKSEYLQFHETEYKQGSAKARRVINAEARVERELRNQAGNSALSENERRAAQSMVASQPREENKPYIPMRLGATHSRARQEERERLARAAEARLAASSQCCDGDHDHPTHQADTSSKAAPKLVEVSPAKPANNTAAPTASTHSVREVEPARITPPAEAAIKPSETVASGPVVKVFVEPSPLGLDEANTSEREKRVRQAIIRLCRSRNEEGAKLVHLIIKNALTGEARYRQVRFTSERFRRSVDSAAAFLLESVGFESKGELLVLSRDDPGLLILARMLLEESKLVG